MSGEKKRWPFRTTIRGQRARRFAYIWTLLALSTLLVAASYTWFSISRRPRVSDMSMYINAPVGLELANSYNSSEWKQQLDFLDLVSSVSPLRPVTWSDASQRFFAANYGIDGRMTDRWDALNDTTNANSDNARGYYNKCTFYMRSDADIDVSLSEATAVNRETDGSGTYVVGIPVWSEAEQEHNDGGAGAQYAIRVGIRVTPVNPETGVSTGADRFFIYEPNCDRHVLQSDEEEAKTGYIATESIDMTPSLVSEANLIRQTTSTWGEANPVQRRAVIYEMGEFLSDAGLFSISRDGMVRLDVYVWLEGQDVDCTNVIGHNAQIFASIQFKGDAHHGGLVDIPD